MLANPILRATWTQESPRPLLQFNDSLEGHSELRKVLCMKLQFITVKGYKLKPAKAKGT